MRCLGKLFSSSRISFRNLAVAFILSSVKAPDQVADLLCRELQHEDPSQRINAILRLNGIFF